MPLCSWHLDHLNQRGAFPEQPIGAYAALYRMQQCYTISIPVDAPSKEGVFCYFGGAG